MSYITEFEIQSLRTKNLTTAVESISVILGAVVFNMLAPQLLIKYYYDVTTLIETPPIFEMLPLVTYTIAVAFFFYAMVGNFLRGRRIKSLEQELILMGDDCCGSCDHHSDHSHDDEDISPEELQELEKIVEEAMKTKGKSKAKKSATSKTKTATKTKTAKRKTSKK
jgi:hypothetical protein